MSRTITHRSPTLVFARVIGVGAAVAVILLWCIFLFANPYNRDGLTGGTYVVGAIMIGLALLAAWGAIRSKPWMLVLAFAVSFVPVGLYALGTPGVFRFVGLANLLYLFTGVFMSLEQYRMRRG